MRRGVVVAGRVQRGLELFYRIERAPAVEPFLRMIPANGGAEREAVRIRDAADGAIEIEVLAPSLSKQPNLDSLCQLIEGVSHFVYLADREISVDAQSRSRRGILTRRKCVLSPSRQAARVASNFSACPMA